ncbi:hypothetical protein V2J09_016507 [Rumex salicifolius]
MGSSSSKSENTEALGLCKLRRKLIKQAIESRYALAASHVSYIDSLRNIGVSLRRFAEAEVLIETCADKSPSHSYASPSPSHIVDSPLQNETSVPRLSYMKSSSAAALTVRFHPASNISVVDDESIAFPMPPPPPPIPGSGSWDYFTPVHEDESFRFMGHTEIGVAFDADLEMWGTDQEKEKIVHDRSAKDDSELAHTSKMSSNRMSPVSEAENGVHESVDAQSTDCSARDLVNKGSYDGNKPGKEKELGHEREDPSEFITHRAKDFVSSIKDIEHRFFRASEAGKEVSKMLEVNKIRVGYAEATGDSSDSAALSVFKLVCCRGTYNHLSRDAPQNGTKIITWKRSMSLQSSSSRNPLAGATKDDCDDSGSDIVEDFCMISGSHSSTLDRLYAWERKLYDEVKASESIRKVYDRTCDQLKHQFAKDHSTHVVDKTRAIAKDLHSRLRVSLYSVDSIAKRIEKMRDNELQPQLVELVQGFIRMWKSMLECHHSQYITISLAYHARSLTQPSGEETHKQIIAHLLNEFECFGVSFANWMSSHVSYAEALNGWLQCCIMQPPRERSKSRRPFSPRRALAPPIFILCRDWAVGVKELPSEEVNCAINNFLVDLQHLIKQQSEDQQHKGNESGSKEEGESSDNSNSNLHCIHTSLTKVLDRLNKFSEAALKLHEQVRLRCEAAHVAYSNCRPTRSQQKLMTRDSPGRSSKPRTTLGDLTNQLGKRGFALISRSPASKSASGNPTNGIKKENDSHLANRRDSGSEISSAKRPKLATPDKLLKGGKTYRLQSLGNAESISDSKFKTGSGEADLYVLGSSNLSQSSSESTSKDPIIQICEDSQDPEEPVLEALGSQVASTEGKDCCFSTMPSNECPPIVGSRSTELQGDKAFGLERCLLLKDDAASDAVLGADSLKSCSCSFCVKAAYIWSDLQYTDVKGRMSALAKSKKEASNLVRMCSQEKGAGKGGESSSTSPIELDKDLMNRCKSLFVFMDDAFDKESNQLEIEFSSIKDIREQFKTNLETVNEMHPDTQLYASGSDDLSSRKVA